MHTTAHQSIINLLKKTAAAHHAAFEKTNGIDDEWPAWYAEYLSRHGLHDILNNTIPVEDIKEILKKGDAIFQNSAFSEQWESIDADLLRAHTTTFPCIETEHMREVDRIAVEVFGLKYL